MKAHQRLTVCWLPVVLFVALALAFVFPVAPASMALENVPQSRATPAPPRSNPGAGRSTSEPTAVPPELATPSGPSPALTPTPLVLPQTGGAASADAPWWLAGLSLILLGMGVWVIQKARKHLAR
jgi:hypothetical protein